MVKYMTYDELEEFAEEVSEELERKIQECDEEKARLPEANALLEVDLSNAQRTIILQGQQLASIENELETSLNTTANAPISATRVAETQTEEEAQADGQHDGEWTITPQEVQAIKETIERLNRQHEKDNEELASQQLLLSEMASQGSGKGGGKQGNTECLMKCSKLQRKNIDLKAECDEKAIWIKNLEAIVEDFPVQYENKTLSPQGSSRDNPRSDSIPSKATETSKCEKKCQELEKQIKDFKKKHRDDQSLNADLSAAYESLQTRNTELQKQLDCKTPSPPKSTSPRDGNRSAGSGKSNRSESECQKKVAALERQIERLEGRNEELEASNRSLEDEKKMNDRIIRNLKSDDPDQKRDAEKEYGKKMTIERDALEKKLNDKFAENEEIQELQDEVTELKAELRGKKRSNLSKNDGDDCEAVRKRNKDLETELKATKQELAETERKLIFSEKQSNEMLEQINHYLSLQKEDTAERDERDYARLDNEEKRIVDNERARSAQVEESRQVIERLMETIAELEEENEELKGMTYPCHCMRRNTDWNLGRDHDDPNDADYNPGSDDEVEPDDVLPSTEQGNRGVADDITFLSQRFENLHSTFNDAQEPIMAGNTLRQAYDAAIQYINALNKDRASLKKARDDCHKHGKDLKKQLKRLLMKIKELEAELEGQKEQPKYTPPSRIEHMIPPSGSSPARPNYSGGDPPRRRGRSAANIPSSPAVTRQEVHHPEATVQSNPARHGRNLEEMLPGSPYRTAISLVLQRAHDLLARRDARKASIGRRRPSKPAAPKTPSPGNQRYEKTPPRRSITPGSTIVGPSSPPMRTIELRSPSRRMPTMQSNPEDDVFVDPGSQFIRSRSPSPDPRRATGGISNLPRLHHFTIPRTRGRSTEAEDNDLPGSKRRKLNNARSSRKSPGQKSNTSKRSVSFDIHEDQPEDEDDDHPRPASPAYHPPYGGLAPSVDQIDPVTGAFLRPPQTSSSSPKSWTSSQKRRGDDLPDYEYYYPDEQPNNNVAGEDTPADKDNGLARAVHKRKSAGPKSWTSSQFSRGEDFPDYESSPSPKIKYGGPRPLSQEEPLSPWSQRVWDHMKATLASKKSGGEETESAASASPPNSSEASTVIMRRNLPRAKPSMSPSRSSRSRSSSKKSTKIADRPGTPFDRSNFFNDDDEVDKEKEEAPPKQASASKSPKSRASSRGQENVTPHTPPPPPPTTPKSPASSTKRPRSRGSSKHTPVADDGRAIKVEDLPDPNSPLQDKVKRSGGTKKLRRGIDPTFKPGHEEEEGGEEVGDNEVSPTAAEVARELEIEEGVRKRKRKRGDGDAVYKEEGGDAEEGEGEEEELEEPPKKKAKGGKGKKGKGTAKRGRPKKGAKKTDEKDGEGDEDEEVEAAKPAPKKEAPTKRKKKEASTPPKRTMNTRSMRDKKK